MNVIFAAAEISPLAKVGGLGDVAGSLPRALRASGADVRVALPLYAAIDRSALSLQRVASDVAVPWPGGDETAAVFQADVRGVPVYLIENERYFGRPNIYAYDDDADRFLFFNDALLAAAPKLGFAADVVHAQDWHTGLLLARLATRPDHPWSSAGRIFTIHNLALPGPFDRGFAEHFRIDPRALIAPDALPPEIALNAMAQGIMHADRVNTVSDTYAREILTPEYGAGLDPLLRARSSIVSGIVNGIDYDEFDPATDPALARNYTVDTLDARAENKRALQERASLPARDDTLLFGVVTRLFAQKGIDLVAEAFDSLLSVRAAQLVVLGTGDAQVHAMLEELQRKYADRVKVWLEFNPPLGQLIYAGCDCFLMPSRYEPCGLGQLISLRYGAVPLVRRTGGLSDTVQDVDASMQSGTGFVFDDAAPEDLERACERALAAFENRYGWRELQTRGMRQDWSWGRAAASYLRLYELSVDVAAARAGA